MTVKLTCCLCENPIEPHHAYGVTHGWTEGHNAAPLANGRCCDTCNATKVIPARFKAVME